MQPNFSGSLQLEGKQHLTLSTGVLQSLQILRMPLHELAEHINNCICENPLLEIDAKTASEELKYETLPIETPEEQGGDTTEEYDQYDIWKTPLSSKEGSAVEFRCNQETFYDMLKEQVRTQRAVNASMQQLCCYLIDCLDKRGYLSVSPWDVAEELGAPPDEVMQAVYLLQSLQPAGVGATSLQECLILQLAQSHFFNAHTIRLVRSGLPLVAKGDIRALAALLETDRDTALACYQVIQSLNPIPSRGFYTGEEEGVVVPDASVTRQGSEFQISLNQSGLPHLAVNSQYATMLQNGSCGPDKGYFQDKMAEAKTLLRGK